MSDLPLQGSQSSRKNSRARPAAPANREAEVVPGNKGHKAPYGVDRSAPRRASIAALLERFDEYAQLRELLRRTSDEQESRLVLDRCLDAWQRLLEARSAIK